MLHRRIEEVSLNSWPALQQILFDGWILRFSRGYTKRSNSVNALYGCTLDVEDKVGVCEDVYAEKGLPAIFRLTPFTVPPDLDQVLASRGYRAIDRTHVLYLDLRGWRPPRLDVEICGQEIDDWLALFARFKGTGAEVSGAHGDIMRAIPSTGYPAVAKDAGRPVACGLGVLERDFLGLFDLITDPQQRNKGYGTQLVSGLFAWGRDRGATHAYLQVVSENSAARRLYARLGFQEAYLYWYRIRDS
jgi:GNAT superfamily N-acetyltransferase